MFGVDAAVMALLSLLSGVIFTINGRRESSTDDSVGNYHAFFPTGFGKGFVKNGTAPRPW